MDERFRQLRNGPFDGHGLTDDEKGTIKLYISGHSQVEICNQLGIHKNTFYNRLKSVRVKLGLQTDRQIIKLWHEKFDLICKLKEDK